MNYKPKYFAAKELVSPDFYNNWGEKSLWFIDAGLLKDLDKIREKVGPLTINDWHRNGGYRFSGLRQKGDEYYNPTSAHSFGKAADIKSNKLSSEQLRDVIFEMSQNGELKYITRMELKTSGWTHIDCFNTQPNSDTGLYVFNP